MKVELRSGLATLADLGSSNGTFLNGDKIGQSRLTHGDKIKIGSHILHVELASGLAGAAGAAQAAQGGVEAIAQAPLERREVVFCSLCFRSVPRQEALEEIGGFRCADCRDGSSFHESMIEGFKLAEKIADGRLGPVYKARHLHLNKWVLLKIVRSDQAVDERLLKRFAREAMIGGRLHHPNIVELYDAAVSNGHYYVTLEYIDGETLEQRLKGGRLDAKDVLKIGACVSAALKHAFDTQRIVHRNVKPSNIFLGRKGEIKLGDFGLAKSLEVNELRGDATAAGEMWGTLHYMSPEQMADAKNVDQRSDVYGLGAALYHAITGVRPYDAPTIVETFQRMRENRLEAPEALVGKACPRGLSVIIARALDRDPAKRFQTPGDMHAGLAALCQAFGIT